MPYEVELSAKFDTLEQAKAAMSDMEEVVGKRDGELIDAYVLGEDE